MFNSRYIILVLVLITLILSSNILLTTFLIDSENALQSSIIKIESHLLNNEVEAAISTFEIFETEWNKTQTIWSLFLDHPEIDNLLMSISKMKVHIKTKNIPHALSESQTVKDILSHIPKKEKLDWKNIL